MTNTFNHAEKELDILCKQYPDEENPPIIKDFIPEILALCEKFGKSGQSGGSAPYTASALSDVVKKLCLQRTISPLTGEEDEWNEVRNDVYQNNREGAVFKQGIGGRPYYLDAIVWKGEDEWDAFSGTLRGITSRQYIKSFPFKPKTFYINVKRELYNPNIHGIDIQNVVSCGPGDMIYFIKDEKELDQVWEYYDKYENNLKTNE